MMREREEMSSDDYIEEVSVSSYWSSIISWLLRHSLYLGRPLRFHPPHTKVAQHPRIIAIKEVSGCQ